MPQVAKHFTRVTQSLGRLSQYPGPPVDNPHRTQSFETMSKSILKSQMEYDRG